MRRSAFEATSWPDEAERLHHTHCNALCRFYERAHRLDVLAFFQARAVHPDAVPDAVLRCIGRTVWADLGPTALAFRLAMKLVDYNLMASAAALAAPLMPDFRKALAAKKAA